MSCCIVKTCRKSSGRSQLMCDGHWGQVAAPLQNRVIGARSGEDEAGYKQLLAQALTSIGAEVIWA